MLLSSEKKLNFLQKNNQIVKPNKNRRFALSYWLFFSLLLIVFGAWQISALMAEDNLNFDQPHDMSSGFIGGNKIEEISDKIVADEIDNQLEGIVNNNLNSEKLTYSVIQETSLVEGIGLSDTSSNNPLSNALISKEDLPHDLSRVKEGEIFYLTNRSIKEILGISLEAIAVKVETRLSYELWIFNLIDGSQNKISSSVSPEFPIGLKDDFFFWLSENGKNLQAFNNKKGVYLSMPVPEFNPANGERGIINFLETDWELIIDSSNFYFRKDGVGEIFSDGNSEISEAFRYQFNLDKLLTTEQLTDIGLSVEGYVQE